MAPRFNEEMNHNSRVRLSSNRGHRAAIDDVITAVNRRGAIRCEERYQLRDLFRPARPADGNPADEVDDLLARRTLVDPVALGQLDNHPMRTRGFNEPRRDQIDPYALRTDFVRQTFAVSAERCFRRSVRQRRVVERQTMLDG